MLRGTGDGLACPAATAELVVQLPAVPKREILQLQAACRLCLFIRAPSLTETVPKELLSGLSCVPTSKRAPLAEPPGFASLFVFVSISTKANEPAPPNKTALDRAVSGCVSSNDLRLEIATTLHQACSATLQTQSSILEHEVQTSHLLIPFSEVSSQSAKAKPPGCTQPIGVQSAICAVWHDSIRVRCRRSFTLPKALQTGKGTPRGCVTVDADLDICAALSSTNENETSILTRWGFVQWRLNQASGLFREAKPKCFGVVQILALNSVLEFATKYGF